jgi:hypothetical protein
VHLLESEYCQKVNKRCYEYCNTVWDSFLCEYSVIFVPIQDLVRRIRRKSSKGVAVAFVASLYKISLVRLKVIAEW